MANRNNRGNNGNRNWNNRNRKRNNQSFQKKSQEEFVFKPVKKPEINCSYCNKIIQNLNTAISLPNEEHPVHFDCVIKKIEAEEKLEKDEYVSYLGKGAFGILRPAKGNPNFFIRKRIQVENEDEIAIWRVKFPKRIDLVQDDFNRSNFLKSEFGDMV